LRNLFDDARGAVKNDFETENVLRHNRLQVVQVFALHFMVE
jgi:hypothetical protein